MSKLTFIRSQIPSLYDTSLPNFVPPKDNNYQGAKVKVHIRVPSHQIDYESWMEERRGEAEQIYSGATVLLVPEFEEGQVVSQLPENSTDRQKIQSYVEQTIPGLFQDEVPVVVEFLCAQLAKVKTRQSSLGEVEFQEVEAENTLSFEKVKLEFTPGLRLVLGKNLSWGGGSNGAGKSGLLQLLRVALYGSTTKGQKHGALTRRFILEGSKSFVRCLFRDYQNRVGEVQRSRFPISLKFTIDGKDSSSGNTRARTGVSTQELVERAVGLTEEMFDHSVIIDQKLLSLADNFLAGTDKDKKQLLDAFLCTERFLQAGELVKKHGQGCQKELDQVENLLSKQQAQLSALENSLKLLKQNEAEQRDWKVKKLDKINKELKELNYKKGELEAQEKLVLMAEKNTSDLWDRWRSLDQRRLTVDVLISEKKKQIQRLRVNKAGEKCPACGQVIHVSHLQTCVSSLFKELVPLQKELADLQQACLQVKTRRDSFVATEKKLKSSVVNLRIRKQRYEQLISDLQTVKNEVQPTKHSNQVQFQISVLKHLMRQVKPSVQDLKKKLQLYAYAEFVLSRRGLVNFLYEQSCVKLNKAARYYSEIFTDGLIQLRFSPKTERKSGDIVNEFSVEIVNSQGGEGRVAQSRGEEQLCAIMCVLCTRELGPKSNLLILDEPVEGLDPVNSRKFAEGLVQLQSKFPCILLATHNIHVQAQLKGEDSLTVIKKHRVSRLEGKVPF